MQDGNYTWLVVALMLLLVGIPVADYFDVISGSFARAFAFSILLGIGVLSLKGGGRIYPITMAIAVIGILLNIAAVNTDQPYLNYGAFLAIMSFLVITIFVTFRHVARFTDISSNRIVGAVGVYLSMGVLWAVAYTVIELVWPGSFSDFGTHVKGEWDSEWLYFSFVTMTTLGYGDIVPLSPIARLLAYLQAVFGQLYIAILIAGLVSAYISSKDRPSG